jgi:predicted nucleic acid-binding Zn ribbon protein
MYSRKSNNYSLKEVIQQFKRAYGIERKLDEAELMNSWDGIVGKTIVKHTKSMRIKNGVMFVNIDSPVIRNELMMSRTKLVDALNGTVGKSIIKDIVFR